MTIKTIKKQIDIDIKNCNKISNDRRILAARIATRYMSPVNETHKELYNYAYAQLRSVYGDKVVRKYNLKSKDLKSK